MTSKARLKRLEAARRSRRKVTPTFDLDMLTEDEVRYMIALSEKDGALTEDEVRAAAVIEAKVLKT